MKKNTQTTIAIAIAIVSLILFINPEDEKENIANSKNNSFVNDERKKPLKDSDISSVFQNINKKITPKGQP